ncbi:MAG: transposase [Chloroflexota bacterium]
MGKQKRQRQADIWVATADLPESKGHPFYERLNQLLAQHGFDGFVEELCARFYHETIGRPSIAPGAYFRMLLIGYFEGIDSERGIAWRCSDSLGLREFLGYGLAQMTPGHSSLSRTRQRIDVDTHQAVFTWVLKVVAASGLLRGKTVGIDATTLEANAAMRSIVRRDSGQSYDGFLTDLVKSSGIETPTREDLAKVDKTRKNKASNQDWHNPQDPDARITKMKDGTTHLAHKAEHAVDMETGAVVGVTLQAADQGDTATIHETLAAAGEQLLAVAQDPQTASRIAEQLLAEVVSDKGYHSGPLLKVLAEMELRSYVSEPLRKGRRNWDGKEEERDAVYANRERISSEYGKLLLRRRGELVERSFAHNYETGRMRRTHLRGRENILKRLLIHVGGFNLALVMRNLYGLGKPRQAQGGSSLTILAFMSRFWRAIGRLKRLLIGQTTPERVLGPILCFQLAA